MATHILPRRPLGFTLAAAIVFAATVQIAPPVRACGAYVATLSRKTLSAHAIVVATLEEPDGTPARFRFLEVIHTSPDSGVKVAIPAGMTVPASTLDEEQKAVGKQYVVFLNFMEDGDMATLEPNYMILMENAAARDIFVRRIRELIAIAEIGDVAARERAIAAWAVECAVDPATRLEGSTELRELTQRKPGCDEGGAEDEAPDAYSLDPSPCDTVVGVKALDESQRARLLAAARPSTTNDWGTLSLISAMADTHDPVLLDRIVSALGRQETLGLETWSLMFSLAKCADWKCGEGAADDFPGGVGTSQEERRAALDSFLSAYAARNRPGSKPCVQAEENDVELNRPADVIEADDSEVSGTIEAGSDRPRN